MARISDGIYRQPASALRELIANAYDADATHVIITSDYPRFEHISIKDDGVGMSREVLVRMLHHIGGSPKRNVEGPGLGVSSKRDPTRSPSGRRLIGKIGIGLFSVAQLSRHFQIITKREGTNYRLVADIELRVYSEDVISDTTKDSSVTTGKVIIRSVPADDRQAHGTEIVIKKLHTPARDLLRGKDIWDRLEASDDALDETFQKPKYHIGKIGNDGTFLIPPCLPWNKGDGASMRFKRMYEVVQAEGLEDSRPKLERIFDRYLLMLWNLGLSAPLGYIDNVHPFDLKPDDTFHYFLLANKDREGAEDFQLKRGQTVREKFALVSPEESKLPFEVHIDGVKLARPVVFRNLPGVDPENPAKQPLFFVGKYTPNIERLPLDLSGGRELSFEAYFLVSPKITPVDHNGVLVRIADASGTLYDETFFGYQIAEWNRLSRVTAEIYILKGLDAALNIDRESFNFSHPHTKIISAWVHRALRQIAMPRSVLTPSL